MVEYSSDCGMRGPQRGKLARMYFLVEFSHVERKDSGFSILALFFSPRYSRLEGERGLMTVGLAELLREEERFFSEQVGRIRVPFKSLSYLPMSRWP